MEASSPYAATAPLMWSQEMYWFVYHLPLPVIDSVKLALRVPLPRPGVSVEEVMTAVRAVVRRHEALRTVYPTDDAGLPFQAVRVEMDLADPVCGTGDSVEEVQAVVDQLLHPHMDQASDSPVRVGLALIDGRVATIVLLFNHIAVDNTSKALIERDVRRLLAAPVASSATAEEVTDPATRPRDLARQQQTALASVRSRSLRYWEQTLRTIPASPFPRFQRVSGATPDTKHYRQAILKSGDLMAALHELNARGAMSPSQALATALSIGLSGLSGNRRVAFKMNFSNRFPDSAEVVGCLFQESLIAVDIPGSAQLADVARDVRSKLFAGMRNARYPYLEVRDTKARVEAARGMSLRLATTFDCSDDFNQLTPDSASPPASTTSSASSASTFAWHDCPWRDDYNDVYFGTYASGHRAALKIVVHTSIADEKEISALLHGMERFLIDWARQSIPEQATVAEVIDRFGFPVTSYGPEWSYVDHSWTDVTRVERVIREMEGVTDAAVFADDVPGGDSELTAYVAGGSIGQRQVRNAVLAALRHNAGIMAPHVIHICRDAPAERTRAAWEQCRSDNRLAEPSAATAGQTSTGFAVGALAEALAEAGLEEPIDVQRSYIEVGGRAVFAPKVVKSLDRRGITGLNPEDLLGPWSLRSAAELCAVRDPEVPV